MAFDMAARAVTGVLLSRKLKVVTVQDVEWFTDEPADSHRTALRLTSARFGIPWPQTAEQLAAGDREIIRIAAILAVEQKLDVNNVLPGFRNSILRLVESFRPLVDGLCEDLLEGTIFSGDDVKGRIASYFLQTNETWTFEVFDTFYRGWPRLVLKDDGDILELTDVTIFRRDGKKLRSVDEWSCRFEDVTGFESLPSPTK
jgi:hypothetical protein